MNKINWRRLVRRVNFAASRMGVIAATIAFTGMADAQTMSTGSDRTAFVVMNDRGGYVGRRANQIRSLKLAGQRVEIRGRVCFSSCTMYLGMEGTCVLPETMFGFHGPSDFGRELEPGEFEYWSQVIAAHYPQVLQNWYLTEARWQINGMRRIRGAELIRLGVAQCDV